MKKLIGYGLSVMGYGLFFVNSLFAKEITILYTGQSHAMLYTCSCPIEADGGVARRATLAKELRAKNPDTLLLDSGGFFAGGLMDEYTQNSQLDMQRTAVNLKAMEIIKYDAVNIGDDEFNFGSAFLEENIQKNKIPFLSCNIDSLGVQPYMIKDVQGTKIGIIGVAGLSSAQKSGGFKIIDPVLAVKKTVEELKNKNTDIIILLSYLSESEEAELIKNIVGVDIIFLGNNRAQKEPLVNTGTMLLLKPAWQARHLGKLILTIENNKIKDYKSEDLRLSDKIADDKEILSILPRCFSDINCKNKGITGTCQDPGTLSASCLFPEVAKISLTVILPRQCSVCNSDGMVSYLKKQFPGIEASYLYYPDKKAASLIKESKITALPAYLLGKEAEKEKAFDGFKKNLEISGNFYILKSEYTGVSYFLDREKENGKLDLFISLYDKDTKALLDIVKEFIPAVHFLAVEQNNGFDAAKGNLEVEDDLRAVCIQKYYPQYFFDYLGCRAKNINTSWWQDCASELDMDKISSCARSEEGTGLLKENIKLNRELKIMFGPTYLKNNQEIFSTQGAPAKEELEKVLKK